MNFEQNPTIENIVPVSNKQIMTFWSVILLIGMLLTII